MADIERPLPSGANAAAFGSDVVADTLRALDVPYIALNPGASYRGLHDSLVNYLGNSAPQMLLCLHEESAVAIAHGYAKVTGRAMAAALHSNVGLMHAVDRYNWRTNTAGFSAYAIWWMRTSIVEALEGDGRPATDNVHDASDCFECRST